MSYTRTYKFMDELADVGLTIRGGHKVRLSLVFTIQDTGTNEVVYNKNVGMEIKDWGNLNLDGQIKEPLLFINQYSFSVFDGAEALHDFLFEGALFDKVEKNGEVILEIKFYGEGTYTEKYRGNIVVFDEPDLYDSKSKTFSFNVSPRIDILEKIRLDVVNPDVFQPRCNPLNYYIWDLGFGVPTFLPVKLTTLFHDIFKQVNADVALEFRNIWKLYYTGFPSFGLADEVYLGSLDLIFGARSNPMQLESLKDLLKRLAFSFFCIAGMESSKKAFVKELFTFDAANTQTLGRVKKFNKGFGEETITSCKITSRYFYRVPGQRWDYTEDNEKSSEYTEPPNPAMWGEKMDEEIPIFGTHLSNYGSLYFKEGSNFHYIFSVATRYFGETIYKTGSLWGGLLSQLYYTLMGERNSIRMDHLIVEGLNYSYMKDFTYGGNNYSILKMKQNIARNETELFALYISEGIADSIEPTPITPSILPLADIIPTGYYKVYQYVRAITKEEANTGAVDIITVNNDYHVEDITVSALSDAAPAPIGFAGITDMHIDDNDGELMGNDRIILVPEFRDIQEPVKRYVGKNYSSQQTITAHFTGTATNGGVNVSVQIWVRN